MPTKKICDTNVVLMNYFGKRIFTEFCDFIEVVN